MRILSGAVAPLVLALTTLSACAAEPAGHAMPPKIEIVGNAKIDRWDPAMDAIVPADWKIE